MAYTFQPGARYRMPTHFGPAPGPRSVPADVIIDHTRYPLTTAVTARFLTDAAMLENMLPPGFELNGEPIVSIDFAYMEQIQWLAGRGYNICLVSWPVRYRGEQDDVAGRFAAVLFENAADPIITGRDELGHPKIYCEIPAPEVLAGEWTCRLGWAGTDFLRVAVTDLRDDGSITPMPESAGWLQYKYIPGTPPEAGPDCAYATLSPDPLDPDAHANMTINQRQFGVASIDAHTVRWRDMPTVHHVANGLAALPVIESRGGCVSRVTGWIGDVGDTRRLA